MAEEREFFDPRQLRSREDQERLLPLPEAPLINIGQVEVASSGRDEVRVSGDIRYHLVSGETRTPMPEAWLAMLSGLVMTASAFLVWAQSGSRGGKVALTGLDLHGFGLLIALSGATTFLLGLLGAVFRIGRITVFSWAAAIASGLAALDVVLQILNHSYSASLRGQPLAAPHLAVGGPLLFLLGLLLTVATAFWASKPRVGGGALH